MKLGVVVPTLGRREEYLRDCIESIREINEVFIAIVGPADVLSKMPWLYSSVNLVLDDPKEGPSAAINLGIHALPPEIDLVTWIGDDDLLKGQGVQKEIDLLENNPEVVATYGNCQYIDKDGLTFWVNQPGQRAAQRIKFLKNSIPQPGSIYRRDAFNRVGGLDASLGWAFDQDLFHKFAQTRQLIYVNDIVASFRWHSDSLSMGQMAKSMDESRRVRQRHMPILLGHISSLWEIPKIWIATFVGSGLTRRANRYSR